MKTIIAISLLIITHKSFAQDFEANGSEIGIDLAFSASNFGGNAGMGLKYGINFGEILIIGPSLRYERTWNKNNITGTQGEFNVFGGGMFAHARFANALFIGAEIEMLRSPYTKYGQLSFSNTWAPTLFLGGGFSREFNEVVRINAGLYYDIINAGNSPFRSSYFMQKKGPNGVSNGYLPIIGRIAFFFPL
jgi:hypothetical protein